MRRYESRPVLVLAAYNAGPTAVRKWMSESQITDDFLFTELIPYRETQSYVKLVMRNYFYYKLWYKGPGAQKPHLDMMAEPRLTKKFSYLHPAVDPGVQALLAQSP